MSMEYASHPTITVDGMPLDRTLEPLLERVVVDDHLHLPDMLAITFRDPDRDVLERSGVRMGSEIRISGTAMGELTDTLLIHGEVTALEGDYGPDGASLTVRGYDPSHRLVGGRRTTSYRDVTDSDLSRTIADRAGVPVGQIDETGISHEHIPQHNMSDLDFLRMRATEVGFDVSVSDGRLEFRSPPEASDAPGVGDYRSADPLQLVMGTTLLRFHPRITSAGQVSEVVVRGWDYRSKEAVVGTSPAQTTSAQLSESPARLAELTGRERFVEIGRAFPDQDAADRAAAAGAERIASSFAEADGVARGNPALKAGAAVSVSGVAETFSGRYMLTHTRHVFDEAGYRTHLTISGRQDRSLLGLSSAASNGVRGGGGQALIGFAVAIVTDNADPDDLARVKLKFPTFDEEYESDWARVVQQGAGPDRGFVALPEVNDEVLVGFESGDIRRPYVIGGLWNGVDSPPLGDSLFDSGNVRRRGFVSKAGHRMVFLDDDAQSGVALLTADDSIRIGMKQSDRELTIHSDGSTSIVAGDIVLESGGDITLKAGGTLTLEGGANVRIKAGGTVDIDGALIELN
ncbi:MAG: VgrG-related protein [Chloroflexota bacterium]